MRKKTIKKAIAFALALTMLLPLGAAAADSNDSADKADTSAAAETDEKAENEDAESEDEDEAKPITDKEALKTCEKAGENDRFILYADEDNDRLCLYVKETGKYWWTSPINADTDDTLVGKKNDLSEMKAGIRKQLKSSMFIRVGDLTQEKRSESAPSYSFKAHPSYNISDGKVVVSYKYKSDGVNLKVNYELLDDSLYVYVDSKDIEEVDTNATDGKVLTKLSLCPFFGAVSSKDEQGNATEGYMIVPDGSGAVINYNNGKLDYASYSNRVYGRDYTTVPNDAPVVNEQSYLPVFATVSGKSGIVAVATDGDANVYVESQVSGQNNIAYNYCNFTFETRSSDTFYMSGGSRANEMTVFEKDGNIKGKRFGVKFFPVDKEEDINYADCAEVYRNYLINEKGLESKVEDDNVNFYADMFGGVLKKQSILGIPVSLKTRFTGFSQASEIIDMLKSAGVDNIIANYNNWTNDQIKNKVSTDVKPSGKLGGKDDYFDLLNNSGAKVYSGFDNFTMDSGKLGYMMLTTTAIRISNSYSRQSDYSLSYGKALKGVSPALISPSVYTKIFDEILESCEDNDIKNVSFGSMSTKLVSDYSKSDPYSREKTMETIVENYKKAQGKVDILADQANAYVLPYVSSVTNVPVYSSNYSVVDYDIPFYQMVLHGYVSYSTKPINASSDVNDTFLRALAAGSSMHYDFTYEDASELKDTDFDELYYSNYKGWIDTAAAQYKASAEVLKGLNKMTISKYEISDDNNKITTTYTDGSKDVVVEVDKAAGTAKVDGNSVDLTDALKGGKLD
ncbi:MAG: DUF5696 domain-containing protein [Oscillospiraceae bacterium]